MAIGPELRAGVAAANRVTLASGVGKWMDANDDATSTSTGTTPASLTDVELHWIRVADPKMAATAGARRIIPRLKYATAITVIGTSPVIKVIGAWANGDPIEGAFSTDPTASNFAHFMRVDNADTNAVGITLAIDNTNDLRDGTWKYSDPSSITPIDLLDCTHYAIIVTTAAATITGSGSVIVQTLNLG